MGHNLAQLGTASLDSFLGLVTSISAEDLPEGASPRTWDTDYTTGKVFTRPGLSSVYSFTNTINITAVVINYGVGTFTWNGFKAPVVNEGFVLSGFTGVLSFLNGQTIFVYYVDPSSTTFLADVVSSDISLITGLNGKASSTTGNFVGPNVGGSAIAGGSGSTLSGYDMLQWMLMSSTLRASNHLAGTKLDGVTPSNHLYTSLNAGNFYWTKGDSGFPWDINIFDDNFIYLSTTELDYTAATRGKRFESITPSIGFKGVPFAKRLMNIGDSVLSTDTRLAIYTACGVSTITNIGKAKVTLTGPFVETIGGAGANLPTNLNTIHLEYEWSLTPSYGHQAGSTKETFTFAQPYGLVHWQTQNWNVGLGVYDAPNDATNYSILVAGAGVPVSDPCGFGVNGGGSNAPLFGVSASGNVWSNPTGVLGNTTYASAITGATLNLTQIPTSALNLQNWVNPSNILSPGPLGTGTPATITLFSNQEIINSMFISGITLDIPANASVTGIIVSVSATSSSTVGSSSLNFQLTSNGAEIGTAVNVPIVQAVATYTVGSSSYQWGTTLTPALVNGTQLGLYISPQTLASGGTFSAKGLTIQVFYDTAPVSEPLQITEFAFDIPSTAGISGIGSTFNAYSPSVVATPENTPIVVPSTSFNTGGATWTAPENAVSASLFASVTIVAHGSSGNLSTSPVNMGVPADATITGLTVNLSASVGSLPYSLTVQLTDNGTPIGVAKGAVASSSSFVTFGSSSDQWGTTLTQAVLNGTLGVLVAAGDFTSTPVSASINNLSIQAFYTEVLPVSLTFQLLKNGTPVGDIRTQRLSATPTVYNIGGSSDLWGSTWTFSDINNTQFGIQIIAPQAGTVFVNDLDMLVYLSPTLTNFNYIKSYVQNNNQIDTLALDSSGILWKEDVTSDPGVLSIALTGIIPGSFAKSATIDDREYIMFSDLSIGTDRPRVFDGSTFGPLSQVGPGAPPSFAPAAGLSGGTVLAITSWSITSNEVTFTFTAGPTVSAGQIYTISGAVPSYLNITGVVLGSPAPSATTLVMALTHADASGSFTPSAVGTLQFNYPIASITQFPQKPTNGTNNGGIFWGAGPGPTHTPGSNLVIYYSQTQDSVLTTYFAANPGSTYVYLSSLNNFPQFSNKTYLVTAVGNAFPSSTAGASRFYFVVNVGVSGSSYPDGSTGNYQLTVGTITTTISVPGLNPGDTIQITGETPTAWNNSWSIVNALKSATLGITSTQMSSSGVATYTYTVPVGGVAPISGQLVSVTQCNNSAAGYTTSPFNTIGVIVIPGSLGAGSFDITGFTSGLPIPNSFENGIAETFGTQFTIDPGQLTLGTSTNPIYGNAGASSPSTGLFVVNGSGTTPITAGTRQGVVFFITESGYETAPSPPVVFTVPNNTSSILATQIPIGPPNTKARGIAFTEAGQNGIPGANFYVIPNDVQVQVQNGAPVLYTSTIINDNITTSAKFTFTDAVLLNATEIDVQGNDLFNLIELGSSAWCVPYASRMFYGLQLNKVQNFLNLSFDGGYLPTSPSSPIIPLGWQVASGVSDVTLLISSVTGNSLYINNTTGAPIANAGLIFQSASVDAYKVPIINLGTTYSVRLAARAPSGLTAGTLVISLSSYNPQGTTPASQFTPVYGTFSVPLASMSTNMQTFSGTLLTTPFTGSGGVPSDLVLSIQVQNLGAGADCEIDRIEPFPTLDPYLTAQVYGSYINNVEAIDASGSGGIIDTTPENPQPCFGGFVMHDELYLLKSGSMYSTQDNPTSEPGGWGLHEVSNRVGTIGIHSYDTGEEWLVTACRQGIYGFNGGQPVKLMQEIWNLWETINWDAGKTIVLRNDIINRRILCAVPLPTPNMWLPFAPINLAPTSPNVILMCNYQGLNTFEELMSSPEVHVTMFGTLAAVDAKRKWSIWQIPAPYMDFITRQNGINQPLFVCNGTDSSKIYQFLDDQLSDDGVPIYSLYTTYGHVNAVKAATLPIFGMHNKLYTVFQFLAEGGGNLTVNLLPNTLNPKYPYTLPVIPLSSPVYNDYFRPINISAQRVFLEFSTNEVGGWMELHKSLLTGRQHPWSSLPGTGGGNVGVSTTQ